MERETMKIMKFGGTCLGDEDALRRVTRVVKAEKEPKILTVSAASGVTDSLKQFVSKPREEREIDDFLLRLKLRHVEMLPRRNGGVRKEALELIEKKITKLDRLLYGVTYTEELTPRTYDLILSAGERLSATVVAARLSNAGMNAVAMETDALGLVTNNQHLNAVAMLTSARRTWDPRWRAPSRAACCRS